MPRCIETINTYRRLYTDIHLQRVKSIKKISSGRLKICRCTSLVAQFPGRSDRCEGASIFVEGAASMVRP